MKVTRGLLASIALAGASVVGAPADATAAEAATCAETYLLCVNEAAQKDGFFERTWAEQKCNAGWYNCVKQQAFGA
jgi:hypothetical protein